MLCLGPPSLPFACIVLPDQALIIKPSRFFAFIIHWRLMDHGPTYAQNPISVRLYWKFHLLYLHIAAVLQCISVNETPHIKIADILIISIVSPKDNVASIKIIEKNGGDHCRGFTFMIGSVIRDDRYENVFPAERGAINMMMKIWDQSGCSYTRNIRDGA